MLITKVKRIIDFETLLYFFIGIYFVSLFITSTSFYFTVPNIMIYSKSIRYICYFVFSIKIFKDLRIEKKISYNVIFIVLLAIAILFFSKNKDVICTILFLVSIKNMNLRRIIKEVFIIYITLFLCIISLSLLNILSDWIYFRNVFRHSLGFYNPSIAMGTFFVILLMYFYIKKGKTSLIEILVLETLNIMLYVHTDGRVGFFLGSFVLLLMFFSNFSKIRFLFDNKILKVICYVFPIIIYLCVYAILFLYFEKNSFIIKLDVLLSHRLFYAARTIKEFGFSIFGKPVVWYGHGGIEYIDKLKLLNYNYNYVDISYVRMLIDYGYIFSFVILAFYTKLLIESYKTKNYKLIFVIVIILIWSTIEPYIFGIERNVFAIFFAAILDMGKKIDLSKVIKKGGK